MMLSSKLKELKSSKKELKEKHDKLERIHNELITSHNMLKEDVYTKIWKKSRRDSKAPKIMSIACRSELTDSDAKTRIGFLQIAPADNDKGYVRR